MNDDFIPLMVQDIREEDIKAVTKVLKLGMLVQGKQVEELELKVANYTGVNFAIAASSGTATLHLALVALGIGAGDEVIVPAFSYIATANVVELVGAKPVFVDICPLSFNIDVSQIEGKITNKTRAVIPVHEFGIACDIEHLIEITNKHNLFVIEDAACALGAKSNGKHVGSFGNIGSFSFHPRKAVTGGEGGIMITNDVDLAKKLRVLRNHGISNESGKMEFILPGFNYRITDFQAALILSQFRRFEKTLERKSELAKIYLRKLKSVKSIELPLVINQKNHTWQSFHIMIKNGQRDALQETLSKNNIGSNYGAQFIPMQKYFREKYFKNKVNMYPNAESAYVNGLVLPLYEKLTKEAMKKIIGIIKDFEYA